MNQDWSKHEYTKTVIEQDGIKVSQYALKIPGRQNFQAAIFTNVSGVLVVTGDWGRWSFCREFHPAEEGYVSRDYWDEKLRIGSEQTSHKFDSGTLHEQAQEMIDDKDAGWDKGDLEFLESLFEVDSEHDLHHAVLQNCPFDYSDVPRGLKRHYWLEVIYSAFEEMVRREKEES